MAGETTTPKTTKKPEHPPYEAMIKSAILALKERKGSSRPAIKKYLLANYKVSAGAHFDNQISAAIKRGVSKEAFALPKGLSGTVKLAKPEKKTAEKKEKKETKEKKEKKPATKKKAAAAPKKTAAARKAAIAKKAPSKEKAAAKLKAPKKKAASTTKKAPATKKKAAATKA
ncbi:linker histone H1 and H5 family-domain-containing protein [Circinella umbellata]|nr:linker histone H1 and H5 family-domain-containing protein [Circinella umbellata]